MMSGKMMSQLAPNGLPLYEEGKLYMQLKLNSNVAILNKDEVVNDPDRRFQALFIKYQVTKTELPYVIIDNPVFNKTYRISFNRTTKVDSFITELAKISSHVEYSEKVPAVYSFSVPNDPLSVQSSSYLSSFYHMPLLNANQASNIHISNGNAVVAIVDDAILTTHEDLAANIGILNRDVADNDNDPNPILTSGLAYNVSHGTRVAGTAGAVTNNSVGIASIGWNNKLMCVKVSSSIPPSPFGALINPYVGVQWAANNGAKVINMSWGSTAYSQVEYNIIAIAKSLNVVLVAAAGNDMTNVPTYPASYGEGTTGQTWEAINKKLVVAVAALDQNNNAAVWTSNTNGLFEIFGTSYGNWVDIAAYGTAILSTTAASTFSGAPINNGYSAGNGTSFAAPMIAGIAGLMRDYDMSKTADQIIDCLLNTANPDIYGNSHLSNLPGTLGVGRADAAAALRCISSNCSVSPIVIISPSSPSLCAGATLTLTANQGANSYSWSTGATTQSIVANNSGTFTVVASYTSGAGCSAIATINISPPPTLSLSLTSNTSICAGTLVNLISAAGSYSSIVWRPGGMTSNSIVANFPGPIIFTATANQFCGGVTATISIPTYTGTPPFGQVAAYSVLGPTISSVYSSTNSVTNTEHYILMTDVTVGGTTTFNNSEIIVSPNMKITVPSASQLNINSSYLHTCGSNMWKGIVVENSGNLNINRFNGIQPGPLIEDAITAISSTFNPITNPSAKIQVSNTVFNKNYIDISLTGFNDQNLVFSDILKVDNSVFTCRDFSLAVNAPNFQGVFPSASTFFLRAATSSTTNLASPYNLMGSTLANLKNPYNNQPSQIAIQLTNVGLTNSSNVRAITIGDGTSMANFNLFDSHGRFIDATNSNVKSFNNVFQNTKLINGQPGIGISFKNVYTNQNVIDGLLDLTSPVTPSLNFNRFYDCHTAINSNNTATLNVQYAEFKSTQSTTVTATSNDIGQFGIYITGNRYHSYNIRYNSFYNVSTGVYGNVYPGFINPFTSGTLVGQVWGTFSITYNLFSPSTTTAVGSSYIGIGVKIENVIHTKGTGFNTSIIPANPMNGLRIQYNTFDKVYRGVHVLNFSNSSFGKFTANNIITLKKDHVTSNAQWGVNHENNYFGVANTNAIAGFTTTSTSPLIGVFVSMNTTGSAQCNTLSVLPTCLEFSNGNSLVVRNNTMTPSSTVVNGTKGLKLSSNGIIGGQGSFNSPSDNVWQGLWTSHFNTYTDNSSFASNSKICRRTLAHYNPLFNSGITSAQTYSFGTNLIPGNNSALYSSACSTLTLPNKGPNNPKSTYALAIAGGSMTYSGFYQSEAAEINRFLLYEDLEEDRALLNSNLALQTFYSNNQAGPIGTLIQIGQLLSEGQLSTANTSLTSFTENTGIEANYKRFYSFYIKHFDPNQGLNAGDKVLLAALAQKCPFIDGPIIYNARALNTLVTGSITVFNDTGCDSQGQSLMSSEYGGELERKFNNSLTNGNELENVSSLYNLFPNPATDQLYIVSATENEELQIAIKDLSNKIVLQTTIHIQNFQANIKLDLINGAYLVSLIRANNERINSKLLITK
jgi:hypothetical protein